MDFPDDFPQKDKKRAYRKAKFKNVKDHAKRVALYVWELPEDIIDQFVCKNANNLKNCNCWMCKNPRKVLKGKEKLTMQEKRLAAAKEE